MFRNTLSKCETNKLKRSLDMLKRISIGLVFLLAVVSFNQSVVAQSEALYFTVSGRVTTVLPDPSRDDTIGIAGALIVLQPDSGGLYATVSDSEGNFSVEILRTDLPGYHYHVSCQKFGYVFDEQLIFENNSYLNFVPK
jgi:hypothetical protein